MAQDTFIEKQEDNIIIHIFTVSASMVGVCLTVIGILHISRALHNIMHVGDDITVIDAVIFLISCVMSYIAMRTKDRKRRLLLERTSDIIFLTGLSFMVIICLLLVYKFV